MAFRFGEKDHQYNVGPNTPIGGSCCSVGCRRHTRSHKVGSCLFMTMTPRARFRRRTSSGYLGVIVLCPENRIPQDPLVDKSESLFIPGAQELGTHVYIPSAGELGAWKIPKNSVYLLVELPLRCWQRITTPRRIVRKITQRPYVSHREPLDMHLFFYTVSVIRSHKQPIKIMRLGGLGGGSGPIGAQHFGSLPLDSEQ